MKLIKAMFLVLVLLSVVLPLAGCGDSASGGGILSGSGK